MYSYSDEADEALHCALCGQVATLNAFGRCKECQLDFEDRYGTHLNHGSAAYPIEVRSDTVEAAKSIIPLLSGDMAGEKKAEYLAFRYTGFSIREAIEMVGIHWKTVYRWRQDSVFRDLEQASSGPSRGEIRKEVMHLLFVRNMHLKLRKDYMVLRRANKKDLASDGTVMPLEPGDREYLVKIAGYYTPQQLEIVERLLEKEVGIESAAFEFGKFVLELSRTKGAVTERVRISGDNGSV